MIRHTLEIGPIRRGLHDITPQLSELVRSADMASGLCHVFLHHTSASLVVQENADPAVLVDLERWMGDLVVDGDPRFTHTEEGPDDMSGHIRAALTRTEVTVPLTDGRLALGTWQAIYLWEHRTAPHSRRLTVTLWS